MICEHLRPLELELIASGIKETFRGQPLDHYHEWVSYDCIFTDPGKTMLRFKLRNDIIKLQQQKGPQEVTQSGFLCEACLDAIMGHHPELAQQLPDKTRFE